MVKYICEFCKSEYDSKNDAKKCEKKGFIGPELKPGLIFSKKDYKSCFLIFQEETNKKGHDRNYLFVRFLSSKNKVCLMDYYHSPGSELTEKLKEWVVAEDKDIDMLEHILNNGHSTANDFKTFMSRKNIAEIHNHYGDTSLYKRTKNLLKNFIATFKN